MAIYLDYAATTPVDERVAARMAECLTRTGLYGNPSSRGHLFGLAAEHAVAVAQQQVAALVGARSDEIVWTSGATESNNLALMGACAASTRGRHLVTVASEHRAVLDVCDRLESDGWEVTRLRPGPDGLLDPQRVAAALRDDTVLLSVMHVNNELGVVQPIAELSRIARERGVLCHVDAAQSAGKLPIDLAALDVDLMSFSAHKVYGPKGVGALYVRGEPAVELAPQLFGGGQQGGLRPGTLATHQIVGMGEAFRIAAREMADESRRLRALSERLRDGLARIDGVFFNGHPERRVAGILNAGFAGLDGEGLLQTMPGVALSTGSACAAFGPSHVLRAIGRSDAEALASVRFAVGRYTTEAEVDELLERIAKSVAGLRAVKARRHADALS